MMTANDFAKYFEEQEADRKKLLELVRAIHEHNEERDRQKRVRELPFRLPTPPRGHS